MDLPEKMIREAGCALGHEYHYDMEFGEMARVVLSSAGVPKLLEALRMALGRMLFNRQSAHEFAVIESTGVIPNAEDREYIAQLDAEISQIRSLLARYGVTK